MTEYAAHSAPRLWVALDAVRCVAVDWDAALDLAVLIGAELQGLFVEDEDLLELAALPIAHELGSVSGQPRRLQRERMETMLRRRVQQSASELERAGKLRKVAVSHTTARGKLVRQALAQSDRGDVLLLRTVQAIRPGGRTQRRAQGPIMLWYEVGSGHAASVSLALSLARQANARLLVSFSAAEIADESVLRGEFGGLIAQAAGTVSLNAIRDVRPETIVQAANLARSPSIVLSADGPLTSAAALEYLFHRFHGDVFIVR